MPSASTPIYLDHNATTPVHPRVLEAMLPFLREAHGNPSSGHAFGRRARQAVEAARAEVAAAVGASADEVVFTGSGTEASNLALRGAFEAGGRRHLVTSAIEHPATLKTCQALVRRGARLSVVGVDAQGRVVPAQVEAALTGDTLLVSLMQANNETGVLQPVAEVAALAHARGALLHVDAAQALGKVPVDVRALGADLLTLAGHKLQAPKGVGALVVRRGVRLEPLLQGGGQEHGLRPGTENVAFVVGLGAACALAVVDLDEAAARLRRLRDRLEAALRAGVPGLEVNGHPTLRLPNTLNVRAPGVLGSAVLERAPEVAASTGSACHDGQETASAVIVAMGVPAELAVGSVRLSLGRGTTEAEVDAAAAALVRAWRAAPRR
jgi:cysteine desulfurase